MDVVDCLAGLERLGGCNGRNEERARRVEEGATRQG
jgi:hypothetical protein